MTARQPCPPAPGPLEAFARHLPRAVDGIEGESLDAAHQGQIVVLSSSWGAANAGGGTAGGGGGAGKAQFRDLSVVKPVDKASPHSCSPARHSPISQTSSPGRRVLSA